MKTLVQTTYHIWVWQAKYFVATCFPMDPVRGVAQGSQAKLVPWLTLYLCCWHLGRTWKRLRHRDTHYVSMSRMVVSGGVNVQIHNRTKKINLSLLLPISSFSSPPLLHLSMRFVGILCGITDTRTTSNVLISDGSSQEVFVSFSGEWVSNLCAILLVSFVVFEHSCYSLHSKL